VSKLEGTFMASGEVALHGAEVVPAAVAERGLVDECRRGDPQAFARLVSLHEGMVFNLAARLLGDGEEARDVSQDVFLQVYRTLDRFQGRSTLKTWIYRIVVNHCRNRQRWWRRRRRAASLPLDELKASEEPRLADGSPLEQLERRERAVAVQAALLSLSFDHRAVLLLREVEGLSCRQLSDALGIAEGTVKSRLSRAREELRERLAPQGREL
jgi:RNA polymerase sigma-70 factor (ECF subfamily)